ncbi:rab-interacting lysosomal protein isoform X2 [Oenanthe melanoleuca]|uniref:rab-interacting lysosomal protein isoform X2 n=1 Tax=Oenanthe melanoleuca TaxID=2939378 RepID=UPI0024C1FD18|nr:rab-interacting lysosomal protein isoform X2 [Oenanthe melanoleuca]
MAEALWRTPPARLAPPHVYRMAGALGAELRRLSARFGPDAVAGLVPPVVRLLELLEALVAPAAAEGEAAAAALGPQEAEDPEQRLWEAERRERALHGRLACLEEQNRQLLGQLAESQSQEDSAARKEREVMLRLKEVVDRQRDELRAQAHEIVCKSRDTEALQEQLHRFMAMNEELRHKVAVVQAQLKSALEHKSDLEAAMLQSQRESSRRSRTGLESRRPEPGMEGALSPSEEPQHQDGDRSPAHCCFSKEELQQILQERNELKTNLFLVQEELAYYQRELLNEERIPSFFLDAMKSNIKKQRKKIRAKMLGTTEESASSEEEEGSWLPGRGTDCVDAQPAESKIRSFFGLWYQGSSKEPPSSSCSGTWEIIDSLDTQLEPEGESKAGSSSPDRTMAPL